LSITFEKEIKMSTRLLQVALIVAVSITILDATQAQAQARRNYRPTPSYYSYPANRATVYSNPTFRTRTYTPFTSYPLGYGNYSGYRYPAQNVYSSYTNYPLSNRYNRRYGNYNYPSRGSFSINFGTSQFGNRGYRRYGF